MRNNAVGQLEGVKTAVSLCNYSNVLCALYVLYVHALRVRCAGRCMQWTV